MTALPDTGDLPVHCCGASLAGTTGTESTVSDEENVRFPVYCPNCEAPLPIVITSALPDALGLNIHVEEDG